MTSPKTQFQSFHEALLPFVFQKEEVARIFEIALLSNGHILIEDYPWVGKTTFAKAFAKLLGCSFSRVQWTSDTLPQDILWGEVFDFASKTFSVRKWPIFSEIILVDEINRMHPKTQSAFLECMEEKTVTIGREKFLLPGFHLIIATSNPIEYVGTFSLPEAQKDRFHSVISLGYPSDDIQKSILMENAGHTLYERLENLEAILSHETLFELQQSVVSIFVKDTLVDDLLQFVNFSRKEPKFFHGISPRGLQIFVTAMKARALLADRTYVIPEDGLSLIWAVLGHRIALRDECMTKNDCIELLKEQYIRFVS